MKLLPLLALMLMAGCRTATEPSVPLPTPQVPTDVHPAIVTPAPVLPPATPPTGALEKKLRHQAQLIEALMSQNDALTARLSATPTLPVQAPKPEAAKPATDPEPSRAITPPTPAAVLPVSAGNLTPVTPNADGLVDLTAKDTPEADAANPFAVRRLASDPVREVTLQVSGIIMGRIPAALINDRLMQAGDVVETLTVESIEPDAVVLRHQNHVLRLTPAEKPARVRLSL